MTFYQIKHDALLTVLLGLVSGNLNMIVRIMPSDPNLLLLTTLLNIRNFNFCLYFPCLRYWSNAMCFTYICIYAFTLFNPVTISVSLENVSV